MSTTLIISFNDLGKQFRLLRHAKSFLSKPDSNVIIVGMDQTTLPKEIERAPNFRHIYFYNFLNLFWYFKLILFPLRVLFSLFQLLFIVFRLPKIDYILMNQNEFSLFTFVSIKLLVFLTKGKLILDITSIGYISKNRMIKVLEKSFIKNAYKRICSTKSLQAILKLSNIESFVIYDSPGTIFKNCSSIKTEVLRFLGRKEDNVYIISIPFPEMNATIVRNIVHYFKQFESSGVNISFLIYGDFKIQKTVENFFSNDQSSSHVQFHFISLNTDAYAHALGCSDACIIFKGSLSGTNISPEFTESYASNIPIIAYKFGCMSELIKNGENGFIFSDFDELINYIQQIFIYKTIDLNLLKKKSEENIKFNWIDSWNLFYKTLQNDML